MKRVGQIRASESYEGCEEYPEIELESLQYMLMAIHKDKKC